MTTTQEQALLGEYQEITLDGKQYPVSVRFNELAEIEKLTGRNFLNHGAWAGITISVVKIMTYCCIKRLNPDVTIDWVGKHVYLHNAANIVPICMEAIQGKGGNKKVVPLEITPNEALKRLKAA